LEPSELGSPFAAIRAPGKVLRHLLVCLSIEGSQQLTVVQSWRGYAVQQIFLLGKRRAMGLAGDSRHDPKASLFSIHEYHYFL
jgi:hypothetical protein